MAKRNAGRAILVLECPWEVDDLDANRTSVLPFIEGVAKLAGDTDVFHANFYDESSFEKALRYLCKAKHQNATVYIAAHGFKEKVGNMKMHSLLHSIGEISKTCNITGIMLGACYVGGNTATMEAFIEGTNLKWCAGYSSSSYWLPGTLVDCTILSWMTGMEDDDFSDRNNLIDGFAGALASFSDTFAIGLDYNNKPVSLGESFRVIIQPSGKGNRAKDVSDEVFEARSKLQI